MIRVLCKSKAAMRHCSGFFRVRHGLDSIFLRPDSYHISCLGSRYCRQDDFPTHRIEVAHFLRTDGVLVLERRIASGGTASLSSLQPCSSLDSRLLPSKRPDLRYGTMHACHLVRGAWDIKLRSVVDHTSSERFVRSALM